MHLKIHFLVLVLLYIWVLAVVIIWFSLTGCGHICVWTCVRAGVRCGGLCICIAFSSYYLTLFISRAEILIQIFYKSVFELMTMFWRILPRSIHWMQPSEAHWLLSEIIILHPSFLIWIQYEFLKWYKSNYVSLFTQFMVNKSNMSLDRPRIHC